MGSLTKARSHADVRFRDIVDSVDTAILVLNGTLEVEFANAGFLALTATRRDGVVGLSVFDIWDGALDRADLRPLLEAVVPHAVEVSAYELDHDVPGAGPRILRLIAREILREGERTGYVLLEVRDTTREDNALQRAADEVKRFGTVLREVHHRVKNNLCAVTAMIRMEARLVRDAGAREALERAAARLRSLSALYDLLAVDDRSGHVELGDFFRRICAEVERMAGGVAGGGRSWRTEVTGERVLASADRAIALGAIVHELVANAAKHAFGETDRQGIIGIALARASGVLRVHVADNGRGIVAAARAASQARNGHPAASDRTASDRAASHQAAKDPTPDDLPETGDALGMHLVDLYVATLGGTLARDSDPTGTRYVLTIPEVPDDAGALAPDARLSDEGRPHRGAGAAPALAH